MLALRASVEDKQALSDVIAERVKDLVFGNVLVYISIGSEVSTVPLINLLEAKDNIRLFAPYTQGCEIVALPLIKTGLPDRNGNLPLDHYGKIANREKPTKIDCCITPLVGFNDKGYRIGYGKGCYDRYFARTSVRKIGLAFSVQRVNFLQDNTDVPLDCCVTEKDVIYF